MGEIRKLYVKGFGILFIDYAGTKEAEKIDLILRAKRIIVEENKKQRIISNLANTYATPGFLRVVRVEVKDILPLIERQAVIGLNDPKKWILKGLNLFFKTDYRPFETEAEAIAYLTDDL